MRKFLNALLYLQKNVHLALVFWFQKNCAFYPNRVYETKIIDTV